MIEYEVEVLSFNKLSCTTSRTFYLFEDWWNAKSFAVEELERDAVYQVIIRDVDDCIVRKYDKEKPLNNNNDQDLGMFAGNVNSEPEQKEFDIGPQEYDNGLQEKLDAAVEELMTVLSQPMTDTKREILMECINLGLFLADKNDQYGSSVFNPMRIFSKAFASEQLLVRIDDKLSRLARGNATSEDTVLDLIGYLILLRVMSKR